eukprot:TRINITY_DN22597_c0_g1_i1.p1 TRINITY_DN22597_c0_g1~~TRINITY_DN22597_c0_g1_i1.p1  ORF type:complete len:300 (-),score=36.35 TRINITY_DN22597_c0_g1_i1:378-1277(-)
MWFSRGRCLAPVVSTSCGLALTGSGCRRERLCEEHVGSFSKTEFRRFPILEVREAGPRTKLIKCKLPTEQSVMGMPVAAYVLVGGDGWSSAYTPVTTDDQKGYFELLVKGYPDGQVSRYLCSLKPGDSVLVKGPVHKLPYKANMKKNIAMIAGGSGITPMLQVVKEVLKNPDDKTQLTLIFANRTPKDILIREDLDALAAGSKGQFKVHYVVDENDTNDDNIKHVGYITKALLSNVLPAPSPDVLVLLCGPQEMMQALAGLKRHRIDDPHKVGEPWWGQGGVQGILKELTYSESMVYKF